MLHTSNRAFHPSLSNRGTETEAAGRVKEVFECYGKFILDSKGNLLGIPYSLFWENVMGVFDILPSGLVCLFEYDFVVGTACGKGLRNQVLPSDDGADDGAVGV